MLKHFYKSKINKYTIYRPSTCAFLSIPESLEERGGGRERVLETECPEDSRSEAATIAGRHEHEYLQESYRKKLIE